MLKWAHSAQTSLLPPTTTDYQNGQIALTRGSLSRGQVAGRTDGQFEGPDMGPMIGHVGGQFLYMASEPRGGQCFI